MSHAVKTVTLLGATGSIGGSTLDVIARHPDRYRVFALTANERVDALVELCVQHRPELAVIGNPAHAASLAAALKARGVKTEVMSGPEGLVAAATDPRVDAVMAAIVGGAGLEPTLAAARAGKAGVACQQGSLGDGRAVDARRRGRAWRDLAAGRQRAQRDLSMPTRRWPRANAHPLRHRSNACC